MLNCGNGWERKLFDIGLIKETVGIDYSESLIAGQEGWLPDVLQDTM